MNSYSKHESCVEEIGKLCKEFHESKIEVQKGTCANVIKEKLKMLCLELEGQMNISSPRLLLALMDAYEVTRDEAMLQRVLDVVAHNLSRLQVSSETVKLLSYCYYYVEDEECAQYAVKILEELKRQGREEEWRDAVKVFRELVQESI